MLANCHSLYAIHQWGREHGELAPRLGFKGSKTPAVSTLHLVLKRLDREAFEAALQAWAQEELGDRAQAVAIDGKICGAFMARNCLGCIWWRYVGSN